VVCVADTHTATPDVPAGDIFLHAGNLTDHGSFGELQAQIDWIRGLPHRHKVVIAGSHDVLLDAKFVATHHIKEMGPWDKKPGRTREDLEWGDVTYLEGESVTLTVELGCDTNASCGIRKGKSECLCLDNDRDRESKVVGTWLLGRSKSSSPRTRQVKIYGTPQTPGAGQRTFGFQYDGEKKDMWMGRIPPDTDILLTHGPPKFHLDQYLGCHQLLREIWRARPGVVVFGHVHSGHGQKLMVYDSVQHWYEKILGGSENLGALTMLASHTIFTQLGRLLPLQSKTEQGSDLTINSQPERQSTRCINAAYRSGRTIYGATEFEI